MISKSTLISDEDDHRLIAMVAARMGVDAATDIRPSLLVHTTLATALYTLRLWLSTDTKTVEPLHIQLEQALTITLAGFD